MPIQGHNSRDQRHVGGPQRLPDIIFGDDYQVWAGVTKAVDEFCISHNLILIGTAGKFALARQGNI